jgi:5-methylthioribose kinase
LIESRLPRTGETPLPGGVSSDIRIVHSAQGDVVVKRALEKLRVKADWFSDPARSSIEVRALRATAELIGQAHVPRVLWEDATAHEFAMDLIPPRFRNWKQELLRGRVDIETARSAGRLLGQLHTESACDATLADRFADNRIFVELRIDPFFVRVAQRNDVLFAAISDVVVRIHAQRTALVHGDYSPKNLLVDGADVVILDCEVAHWGDPRFDVAFCTAHLLLKSLRRDTTTLRTALAAFLAAYRSTGPNVLDTDFVRQTGCLVLARLEGDSPVDYLDELDAPSVKAFASRLVLDPPSVMELIKT